MGYDDYTYAWAGTESRNGSNYPGWVPSVSNTYTDYSEGHGRLMKAHTGDYTVPCMRSRRVN